jgi:hypothetical protein
MGCNGAKNLYSIKKIFCEILHKIFAKNILSNKQNIMSHFVFLNWLRLLSIERIDELFIRQQKILIT